MTLLSTIQSTVNWYDADSLLHKPQPHRGLLTVIKGPSGIYIDTDTHYWQEQGVWVDPSGDPVEGVVLFWTYTQSITPKVSE